MPNMDSSRDSGEIFYGFADRSGRFRQQAEGKGLRDCPEINSLVKMIPKNLKIVQSLYAQLLIRIYSIWKGKGNITRKRIEIKKMIKKTIKSEEYPRGFQYIESNIYGRIKVPKLCEIDDYFCTCYPKCACQCLRKLTTQSSKELTTFFHKEKGWGVKTLVPLNKGEFIVELCGKVCLRKHSEHLDKAYLICFGKLMIDCKHMSNIGRLVNHSCHPNCKLRKFAIEGVERVGLFSMRKIESLEEITFKYSNYLIFDCICGEDNCISKQ